MERRGSGFKKIINEYQSQHNYTEAKKPKFLSQYDAFFLTLWNLNYKNENYSEHSQENDSGHSQGTGSRHNQGNDPKRIYGGDVIQRAELIAKFLKETPNSSINNTSKTLELNRKQVVVAIDYLKEIGKIFYEGTNRKGHWVVR